MNLVSSRMQAAWEKALSSQPQPSAGAASSDSPAPSSAHPLPSSTAATTYRDAFLIELASGTITIAEENERKTHGTAEKSSAIATDYDTASLSMKRGIAGTCGSYYFPPPTVAAAPCDATNSVRDARDHPLQLCTMRYSVQFVGWDGEQIPPPPPPSPHGAIRGMGKVSAAAAAAVQHPINNRGDALHNATTSCTTMPVVAKNVGGGSGQKSENLNSPSPPPPLVASSQPSVITVAGVGVPLPPLRDTNNKDGKERKYNLFFGLHGGGGCPAEINDSQWENHKRLYWRHTNGNDDAKNGRDEQKNANTTGSDPLSSSSSGTPPRPPPSFPRGSLWVTPRSVEDAWNMWHLPYMDALLMGIAGQLVAVGLVDPRHVYLTGFSAGGDGVYKLGPRLADRTGGSLMCAGHPNGASLLSLYNTFFSIHVGAKDAAYDRNLLGAQYVAELQRLQSDAMAFEATQKEKDEEEIAARTGSSANTTNHRGDARLPYDHSCGIHEGEGHWLRLRELPMFALMAQKSRDPYPRHIVWKQCKDVPRSTFSYLALPMSASLDGAKDTLVVVDRRRGDADDTSGCSEDSPPNLFYRTNTFAITTPPPPTTAAEEEDEEGKKGDSASPQSLVLRFNDLFVDLQAPVAITWNGEEVFRGLVPSSSSSSSALVATCIDGGFDPFMMFEAEVCVHKPQQK